MLLNLFKIKFIMDINLKDFKNQHNVYISRGRATKRKILNENVLNPILEKYKFKIVFAEDLSYKDQVNLFLNAKTIISAHGSGLTNIIFSQNATVIELHQKTE